MAANDVTRHAPTFWSLGAGQMDEMPPPVSLQERVRKLPEALLLTAGYYAGHVGVLRKLLQRES